MSELKVKPQIQQIADVIQASATVAAPEGKITIDQSTYAKTLEISGLNEADAKKYSDHNVDVMAGMALATGNLGNDTYKTNKDIGRLTATMGATGRDKFVATYDPVSMSRNPKTQEVTETYGRVSTGMDLYGSRNNGDFASIKKIISASAAALRA